MTAIHCCDFVISHTGSLRAEVQTDTVEERVSHVISLADARLGPWRKDDNTFDRSSPPNTKCLSTT